MVCVTPFSSGGRVGSETPTSSTFYSRFLPPFRRGSTSLFYFYCEMLCNIAKFFPFSPGSCYFGYPASYPFASRLPYPSRPLFSCRLPLLSMVYMVQGKRELGYFIGWYVPPGTPKLDPFLKRIGHKIDTPSLK